MIDFWWTFAVGTIVFLVLSGTIVIIFFFHQREKFKLLLESERKYGDLFNNVSDIIYVHSLSGEILEINKTATLLIGYSRNEIMNQNITSFVKATRNGEIDLYLEKLKNVSREVTGTVLIKTKDRSKILFLEFRSSIVTDEDGNKLAVRGVARDVTEQKQFEYSLVKNAQRIQRLLDDAIIMQNNLDHVSRELIRVHEEECGRISRELHDEVGQMLTSLTLNLKLLENNHISDPGKIRKIVNDTKALTDQIFSSIRSCLRELRPAALDSLGLIPAARQLANQFSERTGVQVSILGDDSIECIDGEQKIVLYRIVQESLTNVAKYAEARMVTIMFDKHLNNVILEIDDDGKGFNPEKITVNQSERKHLGILGMQERVRLINGEFHLRSKEGEGTSIRVEIPLNSSVETTAT